MNYCNWCEERAVVDDHRPYCSAFCAVQDKLVRPGCPECNRTFGHKMDCGMVRV